MSTISRCPITFFADRLRRSLGRSPLPVGTVPVNRARYRNLSNSPGVVTGAWQAKFWQT